MDRSAGTFFAVLSILVALGSLVAIVAWLAVRWRALPDAPAGPLESLDGYRPPSTLPAPPAAPKAGEPGRCAYCPGEAVRIRPAIVQQRGLAELLSALLPIGLVVGRLRRSASWDRLPSLCELHGATAEAAADAFLQSEAEKLARALQARAVRAVAFSAVELPKILRESTPQE